MADKHELKIHKVMPQSAGHVRYVFVGPHFASKVSYNAGAATDDGVGQCKSPLRGRYR